VDTNTNSPPPPEPAGKPRTASEVEDWLVTHLAGRLKCPPADIDVTAPSDRLGLDSATIVGVTLDLEDWLDVTVDPAIFYDYPTIQRLADELARRNEQDPA
jgi:acyl carrier protein